MSGEEARKYIRAAWVIFENLGTWDIIIFGEVAKEIGGWIEMDMFILEEEDGYIEKSFNRKKDHIRRIKEHYSTETINEEGAIIAHWKYGPEEVWTAGGFIGMEFDGICMHEWNEPYIGHGCFELELILKLVHASVREFHVKLVSQEQKKIRILKKGIGKVDR